MRYVISLTCRIECVVGAHIYALDCMLTAVLIHDPGVNELPHIHRRVGLGRAVLCDP
jgi:hypothetical protein